MTAAMTESASVATADALDATPKGSVGVTPQTVQATPLWVETLAVIGLDINAVTLMDAALIYAELGIAVFPLQPVTKIPYAGTRGVLEASTNLVRVERHWSRNPNSNIGIATGTAYSVLDVDTKKDAPGWASAHRLNQHGLLKASWGQARTPSDGGHLCFAPSDEGNHTAGKAGHGLDFRGIGGYVVAPPSVLNVGKYQWVGFAPERFGQPFDWAAATDLLTPRRKAFGGAFSDGKDASRLVKAVAEAQEGNRNAMLYWAAMRCVESGIDPTVLVDAAHYIGLEQREIDGTIRSAVKAGAR